MVATSIILGTIGTVMGTITSALATVGGAVAGAVGVTGLSTGVAAGIGAATIGVAAGGIASSVVGGIAAYQTGKAQQAVYNYNASIAEQNAALSRMQGEDEAAEQRRQTKRLIAQQNNAFGSLGIVSGTGTALDLVSESAYMGELNALTSKYNHDLEARNYENEAISLRYQGQVAAAQGRAGLMTGLIKAGTTLLTTGMGAANLFGSSTALSAGTKVSGGIFGDPITFA